MIHFMVFFLMTIQAGGAAPTTQPAEAISLYHVIVTADDDGVLVQGLAEVLPESANRAIHLGFPGAIDLQAQATPDTATVTISGETMEVQPVSVEDPVKIEFQYFRPWLADAKSPMVLGLPPGMAVDTVMISLPIRGLRFETKNLKKTHLESQEVYTAFDLSPDNQVSVLIYPPKVWWGGRAADYVILVSAGIVAIAFILKMRRRRHG